MISSNNISFLIHFMKLLTLTLLETTLASYATINCVLNAVVPEDAVVGSIDLSDFYSGIPNPNPPFLKVFTNQYPPEVLVLARLRFFPILQNPTLPAASGSMASCLTTACSNSLRASNWLQLHLVLVSPPHP
jgi:hypothetical protein